MTSALETANSLRSSAKKHLAANMVEDAINDFGKAVEVLESSDPKVEDKDLVIFLVDYADALLVKEENAMNSFTGLKADGTTNAADVDETTETEEIDEQPDDENLASEGTLADSSTSGTETGTAETAAEPEEELDDWQLAWNVFEQARVALAPQLAAIENDATREYSREDLACYETGSFIHCRLGDMSSFQNQFLAAISEYVRSVELSLTAQEISEKLGASVESVRASRSTAGSLVSAAQCVLWHTVESSRPVLRQPEKTPAPIEGADNELSADVVCSKLATQLKRLGDAEETALSVPCAKRMFTLASLCLKRAMSKATDPAKTEELRGAMGDVEACLTECDANLDPEAASSAPASTNSEVNEKLFFGSTGGPFGNMPMDEPVIQVTVKKRKGPEQQANIDTVEHKSGKENGKHVKWALNTDTSFESSEDKPASSDRPCPDHACPDSATKEA